MVLFGFLLGLVDLTYEWGASDGLCCNCAYWLCCVCVLLFYFRWVFFGCVVGFRLLRLMIPFMVGGLMVILFERLGLVLCVWVMICLGGFGFLLDLLLHLVVSVFGCGVSLFWGLLLGYGCYCMLICICICDFLFVGYYCCLVCFLVG